MNLPFLPILPRRTRRCGRCDLHYGRRETECPHCAGMSDGELAAFKEQMAKSRDRARELGKLLMFIAALLALGVLALAL